MGRGLPGGGLALVVSCMGLASLGCGLLGSDSPPPEPEHYPIVVPSSVLGVWWAASNPGGRSMIAWPCSGREGTELLHLDLPQGGPLTTAGPDGTFTAELEMAAVQPDGSVQLTTSAGELNLLDRSEGLIYARGSLAGFHQGVLLASPQSDQVEQLWAPASGCGQDLDTSPLIEAGLADVTWNSRGDPCAAPGLRLDLSASPPTLERSGISLEILGVTVTNLGIWVTASAEGEGLHGLRLTGQADGSLTVLQRLDTDLASETLLRVEGRCAKQKPHPRRRRKPRRPGPDHRLPR